MMTMMLPVVFQRVCCEYFWMLEFDCCDSDLVAEEMTMTMRAEEETVMALETVRLPMIWKTVGQH